MLYLLLNDDISQLLLSTRCSRNILARASCESPLPPIFNVGSKQRAVRSDNVFATPTCSPSCKSTLNLGGKGFLLLSVLFLFPCLCCHGLCANIVAQPNVGLSIQFICNSTFDNLGFETLNSNFFELKL